MNVFMNYINKAQNLLLRKVSYVSKVTTDGKVVYLTFDDGPDDKNTAAVLDILKQEGVKATFYVLGKNVKAYPETTKRIFDEGHALGNHSYDHDYKRLYASAESYLAEMEQADDAIYELLGVRPLITRAPSGRMGNFTSAYENIITASGYVEHDWNVSSADAAPNHPVAQDFIDNISGQAVMDSAIILMHSSAGHEETVKALPEIIRVLREKGYTFGVITPMTPQPW
jgi:peptidoglycan/xylan/chitin deacetylase (PgdA/CDA1 family)